jgi:arylsulfatase A-like enzyme
MGKWGLGDVGSTGMPGDKGFDEFVGILDQKRAHDYYPPYADRFDRQDGFRLFQFPQNENGAQGLYFPDLFTKCSSNFIRINRPQWYTQQRPFFLYVAQTLPHANNELGNQTGNGMQVPSDAPYSEQLWPPAERNKAAMITRLDQSVGQIVAAIKEHKQETNTLILFTSDNGPHKEGGVDPEFFRSSGPLRGIKRDLYEGGIRVPLIAVWPGKIPAAQVSDEPWAFWDVLPTLAELGKARVPKGIDGVSYVPTLLGQAQTNRHDLFYWEFNERGFQQAVRMGYWKGVRAGAESGLELYDLRKDIGETLNVADKNPEVVARISEILRTARTEPAVNTGRKP